MNTNATIYYDSTCGLCSASERRLGKIAERRGFHIVPLQEADARQRLGLASGEVPGEIKLQTAEGRILGGVDAFVYVSRFVWWAKPLSWLAALPGAMRLLRRAYAALARNRYMI